MFNLLFLANMKQFINKDLCTLSSSKSSIHLLFNFSISTIQVESGNQNLLLSVTLLWPSKWFWCFYFNFPWTYSSFCRQHSSKIWLRYRDFLQIVLIAQKIKPILYKTQHNIPPTYPTGLIFYHSPHLLLLIYFLLE